jgi:hypothetical protein
MNEKQLKLLDKLRGSELRSPEGLAELLKKENIQLSAKDLSFWGMILATRFHYGGIAHVPEWLAEVFCVLSTADSAKAICDPCAGVGILIGILREATEATEAIAGTRNQLEYSLGKVLVPEATWKLGDPLEMIDQMREDVDLMASILPMGVRARAPLMLTRGQEDRLELVDDLGNLVLVRASMRLRPSGIGLFVVTPSFFFSQRSVFRQFDRLNLGIEAALALPSGTFAPYTNIAAFLVLVRRRPVMRMFVAQLSKDAKTNLQVIENLQQSREGGTLELGRFVEPRSFTSLDAIRAAERIATAESRFGAPAVELGELATEIHLGRHGESFDFPTCDNAIFIPLIGNSAVVDSLGDLRLKKQNYAQVVIDPLKSNARFVGRFLNSEFGREITEASKTGFIPKLNKQTLKQLRILIPPLDLQKRMLEIETRIAAEQNTLAGLQIELEETRRDLWADPRLASEVQKRVEIFSKRLSGGLKEHTTEDLDRWFETLPFPLASILRAWQATPTDDFKTKHEHLLHFFEATAEFFSVILLSAFSSNTPLFTPHKQKLAEAMKEQKLSFERATFGTWKLVVEYLGKQVRTLLAEQGKAEDAENAKRLCADLFSDSSLTVPRALSRKELPGILSATNKMRNDWTGHGGVVSQEEARLRNEQLIGEVQKMREAIAELWDETQLIHALHCRPRRGAFENEIAVLMGSNSEFLKETRAMATWLDVERLYLSRKNSARALKLLPLVEVGPAPKSAKNACYFFNRLERNGARFVSYHFADKPELTGQFDDATEAIKSLTNTLDG